MWIAGTLAALHLAALLSAIVSFSAWPFLLAVAGIVGSSLLTVPRLIRNPPGEVHALQLQEKGELVWRDQRGEWHQAVLAREGCVLSWLIVVALSEHLPARKSRRRWMLIAFDSADAEGFRALRLWLRGRLDAQPQ